jgi:hypothetical protein
VTFLLKYHQNPQETEHRKNKKVVLKKEKKEEEKEKLQSLFT